MTEIQIIEQFKIQLAQNHPKLLDLVKDDLSNCYDGQDNLRLRIYNLTDENIDVLIKQWHEFKKNNDLYNKDRRFLYIHPCKDDLAKPEKT
jgi:hypothetical protein